MTTTFRETMAGTATLPDGTRPFRMDLAVTSPGLWGDVTASFTGHVTIDGIADSPTTGTIRIAPCTPGSSTTAATSPPSTAES
ncbi:hypothetical protein GCM10029964_012770 [Kibdelosporangium lantanae]